MKDILIAITEDDSLIAELIQEYLNNCEGYKVLFTVPEGQALLTKLATCETLPDVVLVDLKMEGMDGIATTKHLKNEFPTIKIIIISSHYKQTFLKFMFKTGASAFVPKGISAVVLKTIIQNVHANDFYFMEDQIESMKNQLTPKFSKSIYDDNELSERETEVLQLISMQKTAKEIGELLFIASRTVEGHKNNLFIKTGAKNIAGLVVYAIQHDIIQIEQLPRI